MAGFRAITGKDCGRGGGIRITCSQSTGLNWRFQSFMPAATMIVPPHRQPVSLQRPACIALLATCLLALSACGGMSGTYESKGGDTVEFRGGRVYVTIKPAPTMAGEYEVDDDHIILKVSGQSMVLTRNGNTLEGGAFGMTFTRK